MNGSPRDDESELWIRDGHEDDRADGVLPPLPDMDVPQWRRTRVALARGQVVGAATVRLSPVMESCFCEVTVTPEYRRRGIGTKLYAAVSALVDPTIPVLARAMSSQPVRQQFAESLGCFVLVHCPKPWVDPTSDAGQRWIVQQQLPDGYQAVAMADLPIAS